MLNNKKKWVGQTIPLGSNKAVVCSYESHSHDSSAIKLVSSRFSLKLLKTF